MSKRRLNIEFPSDAYSYLKMLCAKRSISIKNFVVPIILRALEDEALLVKKAQNRLKNLNSKDLVPIEDACREVGWDVYKE